jgi:hypothetical protein
MRYIKVLWRHSHPDEPVTLFSELDEESWETRKVEIYRNGRADYADSQHAVGSTMLGLEPVPPLSEIAKDPQFEPLEISHSEFEEIWKAATKA